jgi:hypothetical protein
VSKKIRVAWEDLQPGDLIHVKGSTNVYQFIRFTENKCQAEVGTSGVCAGWGGRKVRDNEGKVRYWFETGPTAMLVVSLLGFAYATRPAPKKIGLAGYYMPFDSGEYWLKTSFGWCRILLVLNRVGQPVQPLSVGWYDGEASHCRTFYSWHEMVECLHPRELLTAEEYYTRKAKGELWRPFRQQGMIACCNAWASYMIVHMLTASLHLAAMTPALTEQLNHARKTIHGGQ